LTVLLTDPLNVPSPVYSATIGSVPTGKVDTVKVATPLALRVAVPSDVRLREFV
jgi:hypothetical protein